MKVIEIKAFGPPEGLRAGTRPRPIPADGEVLIKVHAAGVNRPDILQRMGKYPPPPGISDIPGLEVAGEIAESKSSDWKPGDKVCALLAGGGYAEYAVAPAGQCLPVPKGLDMADAAALPETFFTVWNNVFVRGKLKEGENILIHGGASGIGTTAIQVAKTFGANVYVTAGTNEKCAACLRLGANTAINYKTSDFVALIGEGKIDVVLDMIGGSYIPRNMKVLALDGRHVSIAVQGGSKTEIDIPVLMQKRLILTGSTLRPRPVAEKAELARGLRKHVWPLIETGKIKPVIFKTFPLEQAAQAHAALEKGDHFGKILLKL
ncbi:MAG TPA: NAD(P)H-quinone oxidoreductase [Patescibacteria group bacterium]|nr:NAD(P)H-quinone oxidoreductase [Patescibacteria group bacterium]